MVLIKDKSNGSDINNGLAEEKHNQREAASISIMKDVVECALVAKIGEKESAIEHNEKMEDSKIYVETKGNQFIDESTKEEKTTKLRNQMPSNEEEPQKTDEDSDSVEMVDEMAAAVKGNLSVSEVTEETKLSPEIVDITSGEEEAEDTGGTSSEQSSESDDETGSSKS